jgi:hypothetical protein
VVKQYLAKDNVTALQHSPYSPDLAPLDVLLLSSLKGFLKVHGFGSAEEVTAKVARALTEVSKNGFLECFEKLYECCESVLLPKGTTLKDTVCKFTYFCVINEFRQ